MSYLHALILGAVQGFAEFLPISSSGHLAIFQKLFDLSVPLAFDVILHLGTLLVVFVVFWHDIVDLIKGFIHLITGRRTPERELTVYVICGSVPLVLGALFSDTVESALSNMFFIGMALIITAVMLFLSERFAAGKREKMKFADWIFVGFSQLIAVFPGISRSGTTLSCGLLRGMKKETALRASFLLSIPAVMGAAILEVPEFLSSGFESVSPISCILGFLSSAICGFIAIKCLKYILKNKKLFIFSIYCAIVGLAVIFISF